jgi:valyl-tRNA synthetase
MAVELNKVYEPSSSEERIYDGWMKKGYFKAVVDKGKTPYSITMPPPNITGQLHMGHALDVTIQDLIIRAKRMQGYSVLWQPGTDHASIATEARIVEAMAQEGITKEEIGREAFLERAWNWNRRFGGRIVRQLKKIGCSCDWDRLRFTMDDASCKAVNKAFIDYYNKGLIYRGERIINWCPNCKTSISDAEVEFVESEGFLWHIKYPVAGTLEFIEVATTRPETMLGDTAVAVNPKDKRYKDLIGKTAILPIVNRDIPIVADEYVDVEFGTGAVKITPAHDPNDFEVAQRHNLPALNIMNEDGTINEDGGVYSGLDRNEARKKIVEDLKSLGLLSKIEPLTHNIGCCYRCDTLIEPRLSMQWFVKMKPLAEPAIEAVLKGDTKFIPEHFEKTYFNWMNNIRDWCISRQLWWGHQIPAYYCGNCGEVIVSEDKPDRCNRCGDNRLVRDEDTLDTWFSSALWPFSTLGWPEKTEEMDYFYPNDTLVTGYDIIFFWVARMIFSGIENVGKTPFKNVLIHGMVRDEQGRKMSKSLNNGIDPIDIIERFGVDALRFALINGISAGNDTRFSEEKITSSRNFANKIWNAARFILMNDVSDVVPGSPPAELSLEDKWLMNGLNRLIKEVRENIENFDLGVAVGKLYDFIWDVFCDWYIEISKLKLNSDDPKQKMNSKQMLVYAFTELLKLLHPIMPFITEEIYQALPHNCESIMISNYPDFNEKINFDFEEKQLEEIIEVIKGIRVIRGEMNIPPSRRTGLYIETKNESLFVESLPYLKRFAFADSIEIGESFEGLEDAIQVITGNARVLIPASQLVDVDKELERLGKELAACEKDIDLLSNRLSNEQFLTKAPENIVSNEKAKLEKAMTKKNLIEESISKLKANRIE